MAYPAPLIRLRFGGTLPGPEEWQCGLSFCNLTDGSTLADTRGAFESFSLADVAEDISTWWTGSGIPWAVGVSLDYVEAALITTAGLYDTVTAENPRQVEYSSPITVGPWTRVDNQRALAVTLASGSSLGKGNYGRFYLPPIAFTPEASTGQISGANAGTVLTSTVTMLEAIKGEVDTVSTNMHLVIPTEVGAMHKQVNQVKVGRVFDTQRRRRRSVPEDYVVDTTVSL